MKILFVYSEIVVERVKGQLYHNFLPDIIERYSSYGELTVCVSAEDVDRSNCQLINHVKNVCYEFISKENSIKKRFINRSDNNRILREQIKQADLVIVHVPCSVQDIVAKWCKKFSKRYIGVVVGCPWDSLRYHSWKGKLIAPFSYLSLRKFMANVPYAIYVTDCFLQKRYPTNGKNIGCSDVAIPLLQSEEIISERISYIKTGNNTLNLVSVGAVGNPVKGHEDVIKALKYLNKTKKKYKYHLIGGGDINRLKSLAKKLNVEGNVVFHGQKSHKEIFSILMKMDIYVQPSRTEGLSRAIIEALSVGCPVIATKVGGNIELISSEYLYKPGAILDLAELIIRLSNTNEQISSARYALKKAQEYSTHRLDAKRNDFIQGIIDNL